MNYPIDIRRCSDAEVRSIQMEFDDYGLALYMFTDGNYGCDCNRELFWLRGDGQEPEPCTTTCGEDRYLVRVHDPGRPAGGFVLDEWTHGRQS